MQTHTSQRKQRSATWWIGVIAGGIALAPILLGLVSVVLLLVAHAITTR